MDTIEERNLNRLRRGKMMLEYSQTKRSWGLAFALTFFFGWTGVHRFYLGHKLIGLGILLVSLVILMAFVFENSQILTLPLFIITLIMFQVFLVIEVILSFWYTSRVNRKIKSKLESKYGVENYSV